jgi:hypothetical protein
MSYLSDADWDEYKDIIDSVHDDFNQETLIWKKFKKTLNRFSEGKNQDYDTINLKCLVQYNIFRVWPMTKETNTGALDEQSVAVYLNNTYLSSLGHLTVGGVFKFDPANDKFILHGLEYRAAGETPVAQAHNRALLNLIILKRVPTNTGEDKY